MNDIYSLHTEKDQEHKQELKQLQSRIDELELKNKSLVEKQKLLEHNLKLLLVSCLSCLGIRMAWLVKARICNLTTAGSLLTTDRAFL